MLGCCYCCCCTDSFSEVVCFSDSCRSKKIRCEPLENNPGRCSQCHSHQIHCTWYLPIALTRFKQRQSKKERQPNQEEGKVVPPVQQETGQYQEKQQQEEEEEHAAPEGEDTLPRRKQKIDPSSADHRIYGTTSMSYIMHSTQSFPIERLSQYDSRYFQSLQIENTGEGFIKVYDQEHEGEEEAAEDHDDDEEEEDEEEEEEEEEEDKQEDEDEEVVVVIENHHEHSSPFNSSSEPSDTSNPNSRPSQPKMTRHSTSIQQNEIDPLLTYFFQTISPHLPMINEHQFHYLTQKQSQQTHPRSILGSSSYSKLLTYTLAGLAAMNHHISSDLRLRLRRTIESFYRHNEILARCDIKSILALLAITFSLEFEIPEAGKICWNALGTVRPQQLHHFSPFTLSDLNVTISSLIWVGCKNGASFGSASTHRSHQALCRSSGTQAKSMVVLCDHRSMGISSRKLPPYHHKKNKIGRVNSI
jgi:hypothetical protein